MEGFRSDHTELWIKLWHNLICSRKKRMKLEKSSDMSEKNVLKNPINLINRKVCLPAILRTFIDLNHFHLYSGCKETSRIKLASVKFAMFTV